MPGSMPEGKYFIKDFLLKQNIKRILDVGPGSGNYYDLLNGRGEYQSDIKIDAEWWAVEIWEPYLNSFQLGTKYSHIIISDIFDLNWEDLGTFDVIILGDVLEHMEENRGRKVIKECVDHATWVVLSLPIVDFPQGPSYGNVHETHVEQYTPERVKDLLKDYNIVAQQEGEVIGAYIFKK